MSNRIRKEEQKCFDCDREFEENLEKRAEVL
jgi:hypothetical protein